MQFKMEEGRRFGEEIGNLRKKEQNYIIQIRELEGSASWRAEEASLRRQLGELEQTVASYSR